MEKLSVTPLMKPIDLRSLKETFEMRLTEIEFESRFTNLFHGELPPPETKKMSNFAYASQKQRSHKRPAPAPPKSRLEEGVNNYYLKTFKELETILARSATLPPSSSYTVEVTVKSMTMQRSPKHKTVSTKSSIVSVFKLRQTASLQLRKRPTFRRALRRKNKSFGDLVHIGHSAMQPPDTVPDRAEPEGKEGSLKSPVFSPLTENEVSNPSNGNTHNRKTVNQNILPSIKENLSIAEGNSNTAEKSPATIRCSKMEFSPFYAMDSTNDMQFQTREITFPSGAPKTDLHSISSCEGTIPSKVHNGSSPGQGNLPFLHNPSDKQHNHSPAKDCPVHLEETRSPVICIPSRGQQSPSLSLQSTSFVQGSPSRVHHSQSRSLCSPSGGRDSQSQGQCSPSSLLDSFTCAQSTPSRANRSPSRVNKIISHSPESIRSLHLIFSPRKEGSCLSDILPLDKNSVPSLPGSPSSYVLWNPSCIWSSSSRMCGYSPSQESSPSNLQGKEYENNSNLQTSTEAGKHITSAMENKVEVSHFSSIPVLSDIVHQEKEIANEEIHDAGYPTYYRRKQSSDHIYEEVEECISQNKNVHTSPLPPPVPSISPSKSPKHHIKKLVCAKNSSVEKNPPPKPPRKIWKVNLPDSGSLPADNFTRRKSYSIPGVKTPDRNLENQSDDGEQNQISDAGARKLKTYYFGDSEMTPEQPSTRRSLSKKSPKLSRGSVVSTLSPRSKSFRGKKQKTKKTKRKFSFPKTFRFSMKTSIGNIKLFGEKISAKSPYAWPTKSTSTTKHASTWHCKKSPARSTQGNFNIPQILIHLQPAAEGCEGSPEVKCTKNEEGQSRGPSPVPSLITQINDYEGCDLSVAGSTYDFYTPLSTLGKDESDIEVEFIEEVPKTEKPATVRKPKILDDNSNDVIYINTITNAAKSNYTYKARSCPNVNAVQGEQDADIAIMSSSGISGHHNDSNGTNYKGSKLSMKQPKYFRSYDDLLAILDE